MSVRVTLVSAASLLGAVLPQCLLAEECTSYSNRYLLCGRYEADASSAKAFVDAVVPRGHREHDSKRAVIIDVRSIPEYKAGHPAGAYNVPYPYIFQYCGQARLPDGACIGGGDRLPQTDAGFLAYVQQIVPDKSTPIYTLCRTGFRSVGAANVLADAGYQHVQNIWEGFVGQYKPTYAAAAGGGYTFTGNQDVTHDHDLTDADKDGWRYYQGLPYDTRLLPRLIYKPWESLYSE
jgi:rhodanese-related sulfurtransferase